MLRPLPINGRKRKKGWVKATTELSENSSGTRNGREMKIVARLRWTSKSFIEVTMK